LRQLIITADDFGASAEVNEAVAAAHRGGVLTAASLMIAAPAAEAAIALARRMPSLRVGLHIVLLDGRPVLPTCAVSHLVDGHGAFRADMAAYGAQLCFNRQAKRELAAEIAAQFERFHDSGLILDHCNAHQHFHLHPLIGKLILEIGARFALHSVRVPLEPRGVLLDCETPVSWLPELLTTPFALLLRSRVRAAGLSAARQVFGLRWSGQMSQTRLLSLIRNLPDGLTEIYLHPANGDYPGSAPSYRYREEFAALICPDVIAACRAAGAAMGGYSDFHLADVRHATVNAAPRPANGV
jgi:hopanoid biosynthesis associated protein HpnK